LCPLIHPSPGAHHLHKRWSLDLLSRPGRTLDFHVSSTRRAHTKLENRNVKPASQCVGLSVGMPPDESASAGSCVVFI
jgi:hypothetical protein